MKNILINIVIEHDYSEETLLRTINKCNSSNYEVDINICDYRLNKNNFVDSIKNMPNVSIKEMPYEDKPQQERQIVNLVGSKEYMAFINLDYSVEPQENFLENLEIETLNDEHIGCVYSDYYNKTQKGHEVYIYQKSYPLSANSLPLIAFSVKNFIKNISQNRIREFILGKYISKHIPKALCSVSNA